MIDCEKALKQLKVGSLVMHNQELCGVLAFDQRRHPPDMPVKLSPRSSAAGETRTVRFAELTHIMAEIDHTGMKEAAAPLTETEIKSDQQLAEARLQQIVDDLGKASDTNRTIWAMKLADLLAAPVYHRIAEGRKRVRSAVGKIKREWAMTDKEAEELSK